MDTEERLLIEGQIDKRVEAEKELVRESLEDTDSSFNPITKPWKALGKDSSEMFRDLLGIKGSK